MAIIPETASRGDGGIDEPAQQQGDSELETDRSQHQ